jgi:hypothetical protein
MRAQHGRHWRAMSAAVTVMTIGGLGLVVGTSTAAANIAAASTTAASSVVAASAAGSAHWRIVARTGSALDTIVAPAAARAWALGSATKTPGSPVLPAGVSWNGHRWSAVSFPAAVQSGIACSAASSSGNVWAFAGSSLYGSSASYAGALRLSGAHWVVKKAFTPVGLVSGCTVLSATNAWVYGLAHVARGLGTWRLKGKTWRPVITGTFGLISASKVSATDIWAIAEDAFGGNVVAHFNGRSWRSDAAFAAALPAQSSTLKWDVSAINAVAPGNVWVAGQIIRENSQGNFIPSPYVLHLSSGKWRKVARSNPGYYLPGAVRDGRGDWWSQGTGFEFGFGTPSAKPHLLHYSGGIWHRVTIAAPKGYTMQIMDAVHVPGSSAMLAIGALYNGKPALHSVVLAYGTLPR